MILKDKKALQTEPSPGITIWTDHYMRYEDGKETLCRIPLEGKKVRAIPGDIMCEPCLIRAADFSALKSPEITREVLNRAMEKYFNQGGHITVQPPVPYRPEDMVRCRGNGRVFGMSDTNSIEVHEENMLMAGM